MQWTLPDWDPKKTPPFSRRSFQMPFLDWISIDIKTALVQIMACQRKCDKPLSASLMAHERFYNSRNDVTKWTHFPSSVLALCAGNSPVTGEFPAQRPVTRSFDVFFYLRLSDWRRYCVHYDVTIMPNGLWLYYCMAMLFVFSECKVKDCEECRADGKCRKCKDNYFVTTTGTCKGKIMLKILVSS